MQAEFWQARWQRNEIGFHLAEVNPYLVRHWPSLQAAPGSRVLVPLCGKSLDLVWLAAQGHRVLGVELTQTAVEAFFAEQGLQAEVRVDGAFRVYRAGEVELYCGDFFALTAEQLGDCGLLYDRAALIALPEPMRQRYVAHLQSLLPAASTGLLITLDYEQSHMPGPPFAVSDGEVQAWPTDAWQVERLESCDVLDERFRQRGLERLEERVYRLRRV
ncbi:thiopurine S-methyltransferase [Phytopseudomonas dryadis]|uniref:Thiopurine S-methyltransferase n=1 Tax=Phytopseudomonas dryadis TaxID=2487520 RepID=A0A4Q9QUB9_9GAMM|nr:MULTISPECIES: thiopurine S-methyltransferase [Pseudomonas]TBU86926.1 thiopurine S-methyltransferase [Pseudomonas dryadis]TBV09332.1 thiopurine S-methyltransferase [Pseudomonas dryadis]TBV18720.1 thiopurine S-methyltransferase [Pseudomonas sp. FRB 230]